MWRRARLKILGTGCFLSILLAGAISSSQGGQELSVPVNPELVELGQRVLFCEAENADLREQVENGRHSLSAWSDNAAEANAEAEFFRRQYESLRLRMEALGLSIVGEGSQPLEQRLLKSVRDLNLVHHQKDEFGNQLLALAESVFRYLKNTGNESNPEARLHVEGELRATNEVLGNSTKVTTSASAILATLRTGLVLGCKEDYSLLILNLGSEQGLKVGMPLTVARGNIYMGKARVVQVRERIAGAIIEEITLRDGKIKVGDQLHVEAF